VNEIVKPKIKKLLAIFVTTISIFSIWQHNKQKDLQKLKIKDRIKNIRSGFKNFDDAKYFMDT